MSAHSSQRRRSVTIVILILVIGMLEGNFGLKLQTNLILQVSKLQLLL